MDPYPETWAPQAHPREEVGSIGRSRVHGRVCRRRQSVRGRGRVRLVEEGACSLLPERAQESLTSVDAAREPDRARITLRRRVNDRPSWA